MFPCVQFIRSQDCFRWRLSATDGRSFVDTYECLSSSNYQLLMTSYIIFCIISNEAYSQYSTIPVWRNELIDGVTTNHLPRKTVGTSRNIRDFPFHNRYHGEPVSQKFHEHMIGILCSLKCWLYLSPQMRSLHMSQMSRIQIYDLIAS